MIIFLIGLITGILLSTLILMSLTFLHRTIEKKIMIIENKLRESGPKPTGFIIEPEDELEEARQSIIEKNRRQGKDTHISELM